ncbi:uncharacterized protein LOC141676044 [Apium graveolens]|uniref:uncharacterized protein LOC141676044 n=1 Tax=Apium graveolens TaxID=4045 RepID=UPI003D7A512C
MHVFMEAHGIWKALDSEGSKITVETKVDKIALAAIYQSVPEDILLTLVEKKTAKEAWEADFDSLDDFCLKLNGLVTNIRALGENVADSYVWNAKKSRRDKEVKEEALIAQVPDEEPTLLMVKYEGKQESSMLINEEKITPKLGPENPRRIMESNLWYLDNGASNHMFGQIENFDDLDKSMSGKFKFGDNSVVHIKGKGSVTLQCNNGESRKLKEVNKSACCLNAKIKTGCGILTSGMYIFLLVDDFSRVMWTFLLKNKYNTLDAFKQFRALVENSPGKRIETLRTYRGGEFMSKKITQYCQEARIKHHFIAPYSPQQNGVVEWRNRTMIEIACSLLKEKELPIYFWGEAIRHSIYLLNRLPTRAIAGVTPTRPGRVQSHA